MAHKKTTKKEPGKRVRGHHRRPRSIDGSNDAANIWQAPRRDAHAHKIEELWHAVFKNMCVQKISKALGTLLKKNGYRLWHERSQKPLHDFECGQSGCAVMCSQFRWNASNKLSWIALEVAIGHYTKTPPSLEATIAFINAHLLDSDYVLVLKKFRGKRAAAK